MVVKRTQAFNRKNDIACVSRNFEYGLTTMQLDADRDVQNENPESWRKLWDQAVQERDPGHLMKLLTEINDLLDQRNRAALRHETDRHKQAPMTI